MDMSVVTFVFLSWRHHSRVHNWQPWYNYRHDECDTTDVSVTILWMVACGHDCCISFLKTMDTTSRLCVTISQRWP